jgi:hypothetical protein
MTPTANVRSIEVLRDFRLALGQFAEETCRALYAAEAAIRSMSEWLEERVSYWQAQVRLCQERLQRAEAALAL